MRAIACSWVEKLTLFLILLSDPFPLSETLVLILKWKVSKSDRQQGALSLECDEVRRDVLSHQHTHLHVVLSGEGGGAARVTVPVQFVNDELRLGKVLKLSTPAVRGKRARKVVDDNAWSSPEPVSKHEHECISKR